MSLYLLDCYPILSTKAEFLAVDLMLCALRGMHLDSSYLLFSCQMQRRSRSTHPLTVPSQRAIPKHVVSNGDNLH
jgi:hypothetical protein